MGCESSVEASTSDHSGKLIVATLNYGGILNSPLEFFSNSEEEENKISTIFRQLIPQYVNNFDQKTFKWDVGKIDQKLQKQRYTPIYRANVGVQNGKLIGRQQFQKHWDQCYKQASQKKKIEPVPTQQQIQTTRKFDLMCYHTLLKFVYNINDLKEIESGKYQPKAYIELTEKYFSRSYLNEQKKIKKVKQSLSKHSADVFFFQEPTQAFIDQLKADKRFYVHEKGADISMLLIRRDSFKKINDEAYLKSKLTETEYNQMNWDGDTCFVVCDDYILISGHLSSKKEKNLKQVEEMKASLSVLRQKCKDKEIVVGADTNSFVTTVGIQDFSAFPNAKTAFTTRKKRTFLQPQFNKADTINQQCKDQIFSTLKIAQSKIVTIQNQEKDPQKSSRQLLPTQDHPFDHFMVLCYLEKKK